MLAGAVAVVLICTAAMFAIFGRIVEDRVNDRIEEVNKDFDASLNRFEEDVRRELDARLPQGGGTVPVTPTPTPFPTPTPDPTQEGDGGAATPTPTASPDAEASPTETPSEEIRP